MSYRGPSREQFLDAACHFDAKSKEAEKRGEHDLAARFAHRSRDAMKFAHVPPQVQAAES